MSSGLEWYITSNKIVPKLQQEECHSSLIKKIFLSRPCSSSYSCFRLFSEELLFSSRLVSLKCVMLLNSIDV